MARRRHGGVVAQGGPRAERLPSPGQRPRSNAKKTGRRPWSLQREGRALPTAKFGCLSLRGGPRKFRRTWTRRLCSWIHTTTTVQRIRQERKHPRPLVPRQRPQAQKPQPRRRPQTQRNWNRCSTFGSHSAGARRGAALSLRLALRGWCEGEPRISVFQLFRCVFFTIAYTFLVFYIVDIRSGCKSGSESARAMHFLSGRTRIF